MNHPNDPEGSFSATRLCLPCGGTQHKTEEATGRAWLSGGDKFPRIWTCDTCGRVDRLVGLKGVGVVTGFIADD